MVANILPTGRGKVQPSLTYTLVKTLLANSFISSGGFLRDPRTGRTFRHIGQKNLIGFSKYLGMKDCGYL